jgi:hypothetical protein
MGRSVQLSRLTVLVVDDEAPIRANIAAILSPTGLRVLLAEDGFKALGLLGEAVDLAIVDTQMPGMGSTWSARSGSGSLRSASCCSRHGGRPSRRPTSPVGSQCPR